MIDDYTAKELGGNTRKVSIMLAETGLEHAVHFIDLAKKEQYEGWYSAISKNSKIPAIVDQDVPGGLALAESGAILVYLAEKTGQFSGLWLASGTTSNERRRSACRSRSRVIAMSPRGCCG